VGDRLRAFHLWLGWGTFAIFLGTGVYMAREFPEAYRSREAIRYLFRANHVYILFAALLNLTLGSRPIETGERSKLQTAASALVAAAVPLLVAAFFVEPPTGSPARPLTLFGIVSAALGTGLHGLAATLAHRARRQSQSPIHNRMIS
jgi:hypothetical protein